METTAQNNPRMTAEEYFKATPETNQPTELRDGEIVSLASPSMEHQSIAGGVYAELFHFIRQNGGQILPRQPQQAHCMTGLRRSLMPMPKKPPVNCSQAAAKISLFPALAGVILR